MVVTLILVGAFNPYQSINSDCDAAMSNTLTILLKFTRKIDSLFDNAAAAAYSHFHLAFP